VRETADIGVDYTIQYAFFHDDSPEHRKSSTQTRRAYLSRAMPADTNLSVLDVGCGWGFALSALREMGYLDVRGIDLDDGQVQRCNAHGLRAERVSDSRSYLANHIEAFDVVVMFDLLEHVPQDQQIPFLLAVYKSLRPGGRAILTLPNASHPLAMRWLYDDHTHVCSFTEHSLRFVLLNAKFERVWIEPRQPPRRPSLRLWNPGARRDLLRYLLMQLWRQFLQAEMPWQDLTNISLELNLFCIAHKQTATKKEANGVA
jgi:2-polyprenyl-3-methyl-5-hydroxy-6-metoxy-1,4-benzoquinol methylase